MGEKSGKEGDDYILWSVVIIVITLFVLAKLLVYFQNWIFF